MKIKQKKQVNINKKLMNQMKEMEMSNTKKKNKYNNKNRENKDRALNCRIKTKIKRIQI